jgi:pilus assembly protein CpaE
MLGQGDHATDARPAGQATAARPTLVIGIRDLAFHQEVLDFLERDPRMHVGSAVDDPLALARALDEGEPDAMVVCPAMAREIQHPAIVERLPAVVVVTEEMTVPVLRDAIDLGARGVLAWPDERGHLADQLAAVRSGEKGDEAPRGRVVAVLGARGGAGATFLASHLAAAVADRGGRAAIVDLDVAFAGLSVSLGVPGDATPHTLADLVPVLSELSPDHVTEALYRHPRGFGALLAPTDGQSGEIPTGLVRGSVALLAAEHDVVILHAPRELDSVALAGVRMADQILLATTQDLFSLYGAKRAIWQLELDRPSGRCRVVVNRFARGQMPAADVGRILGVKPWAIVRFDPAVRRAQDAGRLLSPGSRRAQKDIRAIARRLVPTSGAGPVPAANGVD